MTAQNLGILTFDEGYFEKIWGGRKLERLFGKPLPAGKPIGEAWLVADHANHVSRVASGPRAGATLHDLLESEGSALLGSVARPTVHGRFPLLLKILDAADYLSIQVHPDDKDAERLNEPDVGKTEMWHVLQADSGSELICGMEPGLDIHAFRAAVEAETVPDLLTRFQVEAGTSVFVPTGTVHAIGPGIVLAEIQQNSDVTYRVDDWGRVQADGTKRALHIEESLEVIQFGSRHQGAARPLAIEGDGASRTVHAACRYFAAETIQVASAYERDTEGRSFHIVLPKSGAGTLEWAGERVALAPGRAYLVPGAASGFRLEGRCQVLDYYVPDLALDIVQPLAEAGHEHDAIVALGGDPRTSDLAPHGPARR